MVYTLAQGGGESNWDMDSYKGWGTQIDLEKTRSKRVLPRTDKELKFPRIIRVKRDRSADTVNGCNQSVDDPYTTLSRNCCSNKVQIKSAENLHILSLVSSVAYTVPIV